MPKIEKPDAEWREQLSPTEYRVTRQKGTEPAFTGQYWDTHTDGTYRCICCGALFRSETKFDSGCGWPSFHTPNDEKLVDEDTSTAASACCAPKSPATTAAPISATFSPMARRPPACVIASTRRR